MVKIRLARAGAKKRPFYHIVVADKRSPRDGKFIERLGFFNPISPKPEDLFKLDAERLQYWVSQGAQLSARVGKLVSEHQKIAA